MLPAISRAVIVLLAAGAVFAQPPDARPAYEVASVKLNASGSGSSSTNGSKGQIVFTNQTLKRLIERAYDVQPFQVTGPAWMESDRFDIAAKYPPDTKAAGPPAHAAHTSGGPLSVGRTSRIERAARLCAGGGQ